MPGAKFCDPPSLSKTWHRSASMTIQASPCFDIDHSCLLVQSAKSCFFDPFHVEDCRHRQRHHSSISFIWKPTGLITTSSQQHQFYHMLMQTEQGISTRKSHIFAERCFLAARCQWREHKQSWHATENAYTANSTIATHSLQMIKNTAPRQQGANNASAGSPDEFCNTHAHGKNTEMTRSLIEDWSTLVWALCEWIFWT